MSELSKADREALEAAKNKAAELLFDGEWRAAFEEGWLARHDYWPQATNETWTSPGGVVFSGSSDFLSGARIAYEEIEQRRPIEQGDTDGD